MDKEQIAEMLKQKIQDVELSKKDKNKDNKIVTVHLDSEAFLKMAYLFIGIHGK